MFFKNNKNLIDLKNVLNMTSRCKRHLIDAITVFHLNCPAYELSGNQQLFEDMNHLYMYEMCDNKHLIPI